MPSQRISFTSSGNEPVWLEGVLTLPSTQGPAPAVVVCHPHPQAGGAMHNHVVAAVCEALAAAGIASLRFNFRGVGASGGSYTGGPGEQQDARGALDFLAAHEGVAPGRVGIAGYSFGAGIAIVVAGAGPHPQALAAISAGARALGENVLERFPGPKLFVMGDNDHLIAADEAARLIQRLPEPKQLQVFRGADHFWGSSAGVVGEAVAAFFANALSPLPAGP